MSRVISKPGPAPASCLTCRRRRKKCDLSKPHCERCLKGGFACLGYEDSKSRVNGRLEGPDLSTRQLRPARVEVGGLETLDSSVDGLIHHRPGSIGVTPDCSAEASILGVAMLHGMSEVVSSPNNDCTSSHVPEDFDRSWPQEQNQLTFYSRPGIRHSSCARQVTAAASSVEPSRRSQTKAIEILCQSLPPTVNTTQIMRENHVLRVINDYYLQRVSYWFMPPSASIRNMAVTLLMGSKRLTWTMYLGAILFQAPSQESSDTIVQRRIGWIDNLNQKFTAGAPNNPSLSDITERLKIQLELAFFKFTLVDTSSGYALLQKAVPRFLQLVAADTSLYVEQPGGGLAISFPRALRSPWYELERFTTYDTIASLVLGVPPLVEYEYDAECNFSSQLEWIHGIPASLAEIISQVNSWRAGRRLLPNGWQALERRVLAWRPPLAELDTALATECTSGARIAVHESWRHVVLIYIYMGMCGVSSHDSRVQASVDRIFQLGRSLDHLPISTNMFAHWVVAGLAARLEKHRLAIYEKLSLFQGTRMWLFRGPQFLQILYHLWHGVGLGGTPVLWDDYVRSRCATVPI